MKILIVEDNQKLALYLKKALESQSYAVDVVYDGKQGESRARLGDYDVIILDWMLPEKDGIMVCKSLRESNVNMPILMLTAKGDTADKIEGLDSGADDYLVKPFELEELLARVRSLLRRPQEKFSEVLSVSDITLDNAARQVEKDGNILSLTLKEYSLLEYLMRNKGQIVTREQILAHCWDFSFDSFSNIVDVYIKQLRQKLDDKDGTYIKTVRGVGYQFTE